MQSIELHKSIVRDFYRRVVGLGDLDLAEQLIADDYIQHSPTVKPGKTGLLEALRYLSQLPKPPTPSKPFMRILAEADYVVTNLSFEQGGKRKAMVDLFRLRNGQLVEHWDAIEDQPDTTRNGHPMLEGPTEIEDAGLTEQNKEIASAFFQAVFVDRTFERLPAFVSPDLIQHQPEIADGMAGLQQYLQLKTEDFTVQQVHRILAEGNFVVVQSEGRFDQKPYAFFHIFRLSAGKIVEQWCVKQKN
ncbi:nuclear transport factor 2 family protein [Larkinella ripae]